MRFGGRSYTFKGDNHEPDLSYIESAAKPSVPFLLKGTRWF